MAPPPTTAWFLAAGIISASMVFVPSAEADPGPGRYVNVLTPSPPMRCQLSSDDGDRGGPKVVCQTAGFPQAPMDPMPYPGWPGDPAVLHQNQATITASGEFNWRTANLGLAPAGQPDVTLVIGQAQHLQGWTVVPTSDGTTFTNDATGHGMAIDSECNVRPF
ncbi:hypothetical protein BST27_27720 [Mycobacterium intermedium]|uniref:Ig-like domain-containing protein n=1 Tax=Mycobacterium intermedium TaxID=28445 RepID=A0A1E3SCC2_MYCIE|nr:hypothetical protein [Mycobacterium intermedium]MCV6962497.1 hypothetical protein [Mycobacterium intermedium]ODQ99769.1 hypothetical protein BHQ20_15845 [Mycobacterium intermedium]OPE48504.1 hypothetical protein BV508_17660 [Mycobacterium intermedium]ORA94581.1 hypothetical protein BST27_27720 [Mycobacterium intermedium]